MYSPKSSTVSQGGPQPQTILHFKRHLTWKGYIIADKSSAHHVRYCPFWPMSLMVLPFKKSLTWKRFFPPYKRESPLTQDRCGTIGALHIIRTTTESPIKGYSDVYNPRSSTVSRGGPQLQGTEVDLNPFLGCHCCGQRLGPYEILSILAHRPHNFAL